MVLKYIKSQNNHIPTNFLSISEKIPQQDLFTEFFYVSNYGWEQVSSTVPVPDRLSIKEGKRNRIFATFVFVNSLLVRIQSKLVLQRLSQTTPWQHCTTQMLIK